MRFSTTCLHRCAIAFTVELALQHSRFANRVHSESVSLVQPVVSTPIRGKGLYGSMVHEQRRNCVSPNKSLERTREG